MFVALHHHRRAHFFSFCLGCRCLCVTRPSSRNPSSRSLLPNPPPVCYSPLPAEQLSERRQTQMAHTKATTHRSFLRQTLYYFASPAVFAIITFFLRFGGVNTYYRIAQIATDKLLKRNFHTPFESDSNQSAREWLDENQNKQTLFGI